MGSISNKAAFIKRQDYLGKCQKCYTQGSLHLGTRPQSRAQRVELGLGEQVGTEGLTAVRLVESHFGKPALCSQPRGRR